MIDLSIPIYTAEPLSREEVRKYCLDQGVGIYYTSEGREVEESTIEWLLNHDRPHQVREAVRRNLDFIDFDEWQAIENVLLVNNPDCSTSEDIPLATALKISNILWEDLEISPLDLDKSTKYTDGLYKMQVSFSYLNKNGILISMLDDVTETASTIEALKGTIKELIWKVIEWHPEFDNTKVVINQLITKNGEYVDSEEFTIQTSIFRKEINGMPRVMRDTSSYEFLD